MNPIPPLVLLAVAQVGNPAGLYVPQGVVGGLYTPAGPNVVEQHAAGLSPSMGTAVRAPVVSREISAKGLPRVAVPSSPDAVAKSFVENGISFFESKVRTNGRVDQTFYMVAGHSEHLPEIMQEFSRQKWNVQYRQLSRLEPQDRWDRAAVKTLWEVKILPPAKK